MSVRNMRFVLVNDSAPYVRTRCAACSRPLVRGYLHDLFTNKRYCTIECHPSRIAVSGPLALIAPPNPLELVMRWPQLTFDITAALFDMPWPDHRD
jgi:hypothetical protein